MLRASHRILRTARYNSPIGRCSPGKSHEGVTFFLTWPLLINKMTIYAQTLTVVGGRLFCDAFGIYNTPKFQWKPTASIFSLSSDLRRRVVWQNVTVTEKLAFPIFNIEM
jgi:hypothetical protein